MFVDKMKTTCLRRSDFSLYSLAVVLLITRVDLVNSEDTITKLFSDLDKSVRPDLGNGKPTTIGSDLYVESFGNIEEANMEYRVFLYFRQTWRDIRLVGKLNRTLVINRGDIGKMWVPDIYCYNARESNLMIPDEEVHSSAVISPNGNIFYSRGVNILASCLMDLRHFPLDQQSCYLKFGSYSYSTDDLIFEWKERNILVGNDALAQFTYNGATLTSDIETFVSGNYSTVTVTFSFKRRTGYYLIQVYFPDIFVVALSWIVFWMEKEDMGNRMTLGITSILTIMFLLGSLSGSLPKVSYAKALDWYLMVSFAFVFFSMVESMVVFVLSMNANGEKKIKCKPDDLPLSQKIAAKVKSALSSQNDVSSPTGQSKHNNGISNLGSNDDLEMVYRATKENKAVVDDGKFESLFESNKKARIAGATDKISRILFPFAFILYNVFYWVYY